MALLPDDHFSALQFHPHAILLVELVDNALQPLLVGSYEVQANVHGDLVFKDYGLVIPLCQLLHDGQ